MSLVECSQIRSQPCVDIELTNCVGDRYGIDTFQTAFFSPRVNKLGEFRLRFCEGDIPDEFLDCCTVIVVTVRWDEIDLKPFVIFSGRFTNFAGYIGGRDTAIIEWRGVSLNDKMNSTVIAYRSTTAGSQKSGMTSIEAAYEYLVENLVTPLPDRGDGTDCALEMLTCVTVTPPTAAQIADSMAWSGGRSYDNLLETVAKMGDLDGFYVNTTFGDDDCCNIELLTPDDNSDVLLSECLENVYIRQINQSCTAVDRVHALGAGEGDARLVVTVCVDSGTCCGREAVVEDNRETDPLALQILAQEEIRALNTPERVSFEAQWNCSFIPMRDIWLGDIITLDYRGERQFRLDEMAFLVAMTDTGIGLVDATPFFEEII